LSKKPRQKTRAKILLLCKNSSKNPEEKPRKQRGTNRPRTDGVKDENREGQN
jgi:hypothetical protein